MTLSPTMFASALAYAERGLFVIPVHAVVNGECTCPPSSDTRVNGRCGSPGKHPAINAWQRDASNKPATLRHWFANGCGARNIGIATGPSNLVTVDIDPRNGGRETFDVLERELGPLPPTPTADTGGDGEHRLFLRPVGKLVGKLGRGVDLLHDARQFLVEPSIHASGKPYRWRAGMAPGEIAIAELPKAWIEFSEQDEHVPTRPTTRPVTGEDFYDALKSLDQRYVLGCISGSSLVGGEVFTFKPTTRGKWNLFIDSKACKAFIDEHGEIGGHGDTGSSAEGPDGGHFVSTWCRYYGHTDKEIRRKLIDLVPELARFAKSTTARLHNSNREAPHSGDAASPPPESTDAGPRLTELGNAERFARVHGDRLRYVQSRGRWFVWDGKRWRLDDVASEITAAKAIAKMLYADAAKLAERGAGGDESAGKLAETVVKWARTTSKASAIRAMVSLAQSESPIAATSDMFDADPFVLNVENGTIDLRTGNLRPHRQADMLTMLASVAYDPAATCPRWETVLVRVLPDADVRTWVQRYIGYALTGAVREQILAFAYGAGANGKSVLFDVLLAIFGDYGLRAAPDLVLAKYGEAHPTELADLEGRRLVVCSEIEQGRAWAESTIKRITGDTTITARRMRQDFYSFTATHKLVIAANTMPTVRGTDHAIWRRMRLVPFTVTIPEGERDKDLVAKLLEERAGILAWAVRGCLAWQKNGLGTAKAIDSATATYRDEQDVIGLWIDDSCEVSPAAWTAMSTIYESYQRWCEAGGRDAWTRETLRARLLERDGLADHRKNVGRGIAGLGVRR